MQWSPQPLTVASGHHQAIGVVHFGPKIPVARLVFAEEKHAGQRRQAEGCDRACIRTHEDAGVYFNRGLSAGANIKAVSAGHALGIQQGVKRELARIGCRFFQPELGKARKLLACGAYRVNRQPAG